MLKLFASLFLIAAIAGCAFPPPANFELPPDHPANPAAPEVPLAPEISPLAREGTPEEEPGEGSPGMGSMASHQHMHHHHGGSGQ